MDDAKDGVKAEIERAKRIARRFAELKRQCELDERAGRRVVASAGHRVRRSRPTMGWVRG